MIRMFFLQIKKKILPERTVQVSHYVKESGKVPIDQELMDETTSFVIAYFVIYIIGSLLITVTANCTLTEAMFDFVSSLSTVGLSIGFTNPTTNGATLVVEMAGMLLGRLEIFIIIIGITFGFKKL